MGNNHSGETTNNDDILKSLFGYQATNYQEKSSISKSNNVSKKPEINSIFVDQWNYENPKKSALFNTVDETEIPDSVSKSTTSPLEFVVDGNIMYKKVGKAVDHNCAIGCPCIPENRKNKMMKGGAKKKKVETSSSEMLKTSSTESMNEISDDDLAIDKLNAVIIEDTTSPFESSDSKYSSARINFYENHLSSDEDDTNSEKMRDRAIKAVIEKNKKYNKYSSDDSEYEIRNMHMYN